MEALAETDCWLERLCCVFFFFLEWTGGGAVQWGHKGLNMSTETVRTECVSVCGKTSKKGRVKLGFQDLWELVDHMWTIYARPRTSL